MERCLQLALNGSEGAAPNPLVGAVIVHDGRIIGEGFHAQCGQAHAEVNAIRSVQQPELLAESTIYVSLEPCAHYGKTPPCADLIIAKRIPRVVIGCRDPFAKVDGLGIRKLQEAGCQVTVGVLEKECQDLNRRFMTYHTLKRPFITLKWAQSSDGYIDRLRTGGEPLHLSSPLTLLRVHRLRAEHNAILVGSRTAQLDNPSLNVRHWSGPQPVRLVIDRHRSLPKQLHLFDGKQRTLVLTESLPPEAQQPSAEERSAIHYRQLDFNAPLPTQIATLLHSEGLQSLLVEGGRITLQSFIDAGLWDEAWVEEAPLTIGQGVAAPSLKEFKSLEVEQHFGHLIRHYKK